MRLFPTRDTILLLIQPLAHLPVHIHIRAILLHVMIRIRINPPLHLLRTHARPDQPIDQARRVRIVHIVVPGAVHDGKPAGDVRETLRNGRGANR